MGLLKSLKDAMLPKPQKEKSSKKEATVSPYREETFCGVGTEYYLDNIRKLAIYNQDYRKSGKTLASEGKCMQKIFQYSFVNRPVKLIPEKNNEFDKYAVAIQVAGEMVGHISIDDSKHVREILEKHDVKFISAFIGGGKYKVVSENGDAVKMEKYITIRIKIGYR